MAASARCSRPASSTRRQDRPMRSLPGRVLLRGGVIVCSATSRATALLVDRGRVAWAGDDAQAPTGADAVVDLGGRLVTPGFVDAHVHLASTRFAPAAADPSAPRRGAAP